MLQFQSPGRHAHDAELEFLLRRAEQESIAAIRSPSPEASDRHDEMAQAYSALAVTILGSNGG
jgi:hypothetical protein